MISLVDHKRFRFEMLDYEARSKNQDFKEVLLALFDIVCGGKHQLLHLI